MLFEVLRDKLLGLALVHPYVETELDPDVADVAIRRTTGEADAHAADVAVSRLGVHQFKALLYDRLAVRDIWKLVSFVDVNDDFLTGGHGG